MVEHDLDVMRRADWIVDVGPGAGEGGGNVLYSGPPGGLKDVGASHTARYLDAKQLIGRAPRVPKGWLKLRGITRNNLRGVDVDFPIGVFTAVTGISGSGKSSLVSQALVELMLAHLGHEPPASPEDPAEFEFTALGPVGGRVEPGFEGIKRLVTIDQKPIGRTPRSNLATYTGLFDAVRALFAQTPVGQSTPLRRRTILLQRRKGPMRDLRRRGFRERRAVVLAERLRALSDLPRRALQPEDPRSRVSGQKHRSSAGHDGG